jgi:hypothetical protein
VVYYGPKNPDATADRWLLDEVFPADRFLAGA